MQTAAVGAPHSQQWKMFRTGKGDTHLDFGNKAVISQPAAKQTILLDHVKKEAQIVPAPSLGPAAPASQHAPALPGVQPPAAASLVNVKDLGKQTISGHEAEGKMYTFHVPEPPKPQTAATPPAAPGAQAAPAAGAPQLPKGPGLPALPGAAPHPPTAPVAAAPPAPAPPKPAPQVQSMEVWTHTKLKIPMLTKIHGVPGAPATLCKDAKPGEPPASLFQIPAGYKLVPSKL
jgi:hypothetical protein